MKLDRRIGKRDRHRCVEDLLIELGLKNCEDTKIGIPGLVSGISGGERKRLSFASEILTDPALLFCDEPTTGLDSFSAQKLVGMMRQMAAKGKTIICTIHQPSSQVFAMFDQVCLLAEGKTAYMGSAKGALEFFEGMNFICPQHFNPADFYIRTLAVYPSNAEESKQNIKAITEGFAVSPQAKELMDKVELEVSGDSSMGTKSFQSSSSNSSLIGDNLRRVHWWTQIHWLTWRNLIHSGRNPKIHQVRTIQKIVLALLIGVCYAGVSLDQMGVQAIQGALFLFISENTFPSMYGVLFVFPSELPLFLRENKSGLYRVSSYYISKMISLLPGFIFEPLVFAIICYWMVGLRPTFEAFFITCALILLTANTASALGCLFSTAFDNVTVAIMCLIPLEQFWKVTGGLFINIGTMPELLKWTKYFSWFVYANEALSVTQWTGISNITCDADENQPCIRTGQEVLDLRSFSENHWTLDFVGMIALYLAFHIGAYTCLLVKSRRK